MIIKRISNADETLYSVESPANAHRYSEVRITPILHLYCQNSDKDIADEEFVYLNKLYVDCVVESGNSIIAFKDLSYNEIVYDDLFRRAARCYNTSNGEIYADCDIVYLIEFQYLTDRNQYKPEKVVLSRESTAINLLSKSRLLVDLSLKERIVKAMETDDIHSFDSVKKIDYQGFEPSCFADPTEELLKSISAECIDFIEDFQNKHGIISFYIAQNESKR